MSDDSVKSDRRPLKTRSWSVFQHASVWLAARGVTPNQISVASVVFAFIGGCGLLLTGRLTEPLWIRFAWLLAVIGTRQMQKESQPIFLSNLFTRDERFTAWSIVSILPRR